MEIFLEPLNALNPNDGGATYLALYSLAATLAGYLVGSLSFAVIVSRVMGLSDPRSYGSKNPGATNVLRSGSKLAAVLTLLLDAIKGWLPVFLVQHYGAAYGLEAGTAALVGVAAFLGHVYPVFFRFQGAVLGLATGVTWLLIAYFFRYSSLASLVAAVFAPVYYLMGDGVAWRSDNPVVLALVAICAMLVWRHSENISRLVKGTESRLGTK